MGPLACVVLSKNLGIGIAEINWKQYKAIKSGIRARISSVKTKKQVMVFGMYQELKSKHKRTAMASAGKLWDDNNFVYYKMDPFCKEIFQVLVTEEDDGSDVRIVRFWEETWEKKEVGPNGHARIESRLVRKYSGLQWLDLDNTVNSYSRRTAHPDQVYF